MKEIRSLGPLAEVLPDPVGLGKITKSIRPNYQENYQIADVAPQSVLFYINSMNSWVILVWKRGVWGGEILFLA